MKYYPWQLDQIIQKIQQQFIKAILVYGPNKGYIRKISQSLSTKLNLTPVNISLQSQSPNHLYNILNTANFFNQKQLVRITELPAFNSEFKAILSEPNFMHFPIFIADELAASAAIRKYFETNGNLACIACYNDEGQILEKNIIAIVNQYKKTISEEALEYLKIQLKGDYGLTVNELEKLFDYLTIKGTNHIELVDAKEVLSSNISASGDDLCIFFAQKKAHLLLREYKNLQEQGCNEVLIIRAIMRYYLNLYQVLLLMAQNITLADALKTLQPPIFFKYENDFKEVLQGTNTQQVIKTLKLLQQAEVEYKLRPHSFDFFNHLYLPVQSLD